jgi:imidazoleglycerol-phosphate dehydratase
MSDRTATISRKTNETEIEVYINLDCQPGSASQQIIDISTGIGFLDHVRFSTASYYDTTLG